MRAPLLAAAIAAFAACAAAPRTGPRERCVVAEVVDGDTIRCRSGLRVRLLGIDAPERDQGEPYRLARRALATLAPVGQAVELETDVRATDRYRRRLAWVWRGERLLNEPVVRDGWVVLYTIPPNVRHVERLERAQRLAREGRAGLWARGAFDCLPSDHRRGRC